MQASGKTLLSKLVAGLCGCKPHSTLHLELTDYQQTPHAQPLHIVDSPAEPGLPGWRLHIIAFQDKGTYLQHHRGSGLSSRFHSSSTNITG